MKVITISGFCINSLLRTVLRGTIGVRAGICQFLTAIGIEGGQARNLTIHLSQVSGIDNFQA